MTPIFETCEPRPEVLQGDLREDIFAVRLRDVEGRAKDVYGAPAVFFENIFPTDALRDLLTADRGAGRLTGRKGSAGPIIRLETAFGGGKIRNLIALYHTVRHQTTGAAGDSQWLGTSRYSRATHSYTGTRMTAFKHCE